MMLKEIGSISVVFCFLLAITKATAAKDALQNTVSRVDMKNCDQYSIKIYNQSHFFSKDILDGLEAA